MSSLSYGVRATTSADEFFTWVDTDFLMERKLGAIVPWFAPRGDNLAMAQINGARGIEKGLTLDVFHVKSFRR